MSEGMDAGDLKLYADTRFDSLTREIDQRFADLGRQLESVIAVARAALPKAEFDRWADSTLSNVHELVEAVQQLSVQQTGYLPVASFDAYTARKDAERASDRRSLVAAWIAAGAALLAAVITIIVTLALAP